MLHLVKVICQLLQACLNSDELFSRYPRFTVASVGQHMPLKLLVTVPWCGRGKTASRSQANPGAGKASLQQHRNDSTRRPDSPEAAFDYAESMEQGRAANADTRLQSSLDTAHCLTPTGGFARP